MAISLEHKLSAKGITWSEFCGDPYSLLAECPPIFAMYCERKEGFFLFDRNLIKQILVNGDTLDKRFSPSHISTEKSVEFFSSWIFFRDGRSQKALKKKLFGCLSREELRLSSDWSLPPISIDDLFSTVRKHIFGSIITIFFKLPPDKIDFYFRHAEAIFSSFQGDRPVIYDNIDDHIEALWALYNEEKKFDFSETFFRSAVLNAVVDGYEPLNDAVWNTVDVLMTNHQIDPRLAYRIAIGLLPSFRYVVRTLRDSYELRDGSIIRGKVYCFLSSQIFSYSENSSPFLSYGAGAHICAGRGLADQLVPHVAAGVRSYLESENVERIAISRSDGLGAEGIRGVTVYPKQKASRFLESVTVQTRSS